MAEQLICNQQVDGSTPFASSNSCNNILGDFPSGQRGQTVNLLSLTSVVRIHHPPPQKKDTKRCPFFVLGMRTDHSFRLRKCGSLFLPEPKSARKCRRSKKPHSEGRESTFNHTKRCPFVGGG